MQIEHDRARITAGVMNGHTTGGPIALVIENRDWRNWREKDIQPFTVPRPGHADLTGAVKYGYRDLRLSLERASARETAARVAVGAVCKRLLAEFGITVGSYVTMTAASKQSCRPTPHRRGTASGSSRRRSEVRCRCPPPPTRCGAHPRGHQAKDTLGSVFEVALGVPPGLGSHVHYDRKLVER